MSVQDIFLSFHSKITQLTLFPNVLLFDETNVADILSYKQYLANLVFVPIC